VATLFTPWLAAQTDAPFDVVSTVEPVMSDAIHQRFPVNYKAFFKPRV
jgi:hypothetical protein